MAIIENVTGGSPATVAVSVYVPRSAPSVYCTVATPPVSVVLVAAPTVPVGALQFTTLPVIAFPNSSTTFTLNDSFEPAIAAGLSDPNFCTAFGAPAVSVIVNVRPGSEPA